MTETAENEEPDTLAPPGDGEEDDFPWESLEVPSWVVLLIGLAIIVIGVASIWKALG